MNAEQIFSFAEQSDPTNLVDNLTNDISASSATGVAGVVNLNSLNIDPSQKIIELPTIFLSKPLTLDPFCRASNPGNTFVFSGSGGVPSNPINLRNTSLPWEDWNIQKSLDSKKIQKHIKKSSSAAKADIIAIKEAQGWVKPHNGPYQLVLETPSISQNNLSKASNCPSINTLAPKY